MAVKSAFSYVFSFLRPFAAQPLTAENISSPASPRTPICIEGPVDSSTQAAVQQQRASAASPPVSPFIAPVVKEKSLRVIDPALFLIERLNERWFEDNVVGLNWWDVCTLSWGSSRPPQIQPSTGDLMAWVPANLSDSELYSGPPSGIRSPDSSSSKSSSQQHLFPAIEMVQPLVSSTSGSCSADRDLRGLPGSRLRRLPRVYPDDEISLSDGEQMRYPRSFRSQSEDLPDALRRFSERQFEASPKAKPSLRRRKEKLVSLVMEPSRRFSDGEEPGEGARAPLLNARDRGVSHLVANSSSRTSKSNVVASKVRDSIKMERPAAGKLECESWERKRRRPQKTGSMPALPPSRWRRRDRRKSSKSLTEGEYDEARGLTDLGFNFTRDDQSEPGMGVLPGVKSFSRDSDELLQSPNRSSRIRSPRGWPRHPDPPLLKWRIPSSHDGTVDMKAQLKFWAHSVASTVSAEC